MVRGPETSSSSRKGIHCPGAWRDGEGRWSFQILEAGDKRSKHQGGDGRLYLVGAEPVEGAAMPSEAGEGEPTLYLPKWLGNVVHFRENEGINLNTRQKVTSIVVLRRS